MNMNTYPSSTSNPNTSASSSQYPHSQSINPALLASFQQQQQQQQKFSGNSRGFGGSVNPAQLMNGGSMNPVHLQQQQQQHQMMNGGMMGMGSGGGSINPAALSNPAGPSTSSAQGGQMPMSISSSSMAAMIQAMGMSKEQFNGLTPQERHMVGGQIMNMVQQREAMANQNQQQQQQQQTFERPSSSSSSHSASNPSQAQHMQQQNSGGVMMPPPPPRPSTAMGMGQMMNAGGHPSRPGTSMAHRSPVIPGDPQQQQRMLQMQMQMQQQQQQQQQHQSQGMGMGNMGGMALGGGNMGMAGMQLDPQQRMQLEQRMYQQQQQREMQQMQQQQMQRPLSRLAIGGSMMNQMNGFTGQGTPKIAPQQLQNSQQHQQQQQAQFLTQSPRLQSSIPLPGHVQLQHPQQQQQQPQGGQQGQLQPSQPQPQSHNIHPLNLNLGQNPYPTSNAAPNSAGSMHTPTQSSPPQTPVPGSPFRGAKRKLGSDGSVVGMGNVSSPQQQQQQQQQQLQQQGNVPGSPRMGSAQGMMRSVSGSGSLSGDGMGFAMSGVNGFVPQQQQQQGQSPRPGSSMGMSGGGGAGGLMGMGVPPGGVTSMGLGITGMGMNIGDINSVNAMGGMVGMGSVNPMTALGAMGGGGVGMNTMGGMVAPQRSGQRQSSMPPPSAPVQFQQQQQLGQQGHQRQGSLPPGNMGMGGMKPGMGGVGTGMGMGMPPPSSIAGGMSASLSGGLGLGAGMLGSPAQAIPPSLSASSSTSGILGGGSAGSLLSPGSLGVVNSAAAAAAVSSANAVGGMAGQTSSPLGILHQLPPLPANVNLNPTITRVTPVPLVDSLKLIPALSDTEIQNIQGWVQKDKEYESDYRKMKEKMGDEVREVFGVRSFCWWEKGFSGGNLNRWRRGREMFDVRYPKKVRERDGRERRKPGRREGLKLPRRLDPEDADRPEQLVPIRLEFDVEHHRMRDTFVWNLNDPVITPENFAQSLVEDYSLPSLYHSVIVKSIQDQLSDYKAHSSNFDVDGAEYRSSEDPTLRGSLNEESAVWWEAWRKRARNESASGRKGRKQKKRRVKQEADGDDADREDEGDVLPTFPELDNKPLALHEIEVNEANMHEEMRILIKLDIIVGTMKLDDQFEWDLENTTVTPEEFADIYTQDLGLNGEFKTAISHSIREQVQTYQKSLFLVGHPSDGSVIQDEELRQSFLPSLVSGTRPVGEVQLFTPLLNYLSDGEIDRTEKERDKDLNKRRKRNTRGRRGIALPDREPIRTYRTPAIGFPELDPATLASAVAASAPMSRRAAAAAASLTIANMVASENGTAFVPQTMQNTPQPAPMAPKEKKVKGLFKAPSYPQSVLRPRAQVTAPTPSTAADTSNLPAPLENDPPVVQPAPQLDNRNAKMISAKRAKELEREAKEKEFVDGQHPNYIEGVWHCSNCGCPESIAVGRRKGPLGDKSQCGTCGKFWHRHRRPRPVEYNSDADFHSGLLKRETEAKTPMSKKKGAAAALRAAAAAAAASSTPAADVSEPQTPSRSNGDMSRQSPAPAHNDDDRGISPVSTASSGSEPPLAQRVKMNGTSHKANAPAPSTPAPPPSMSTSTSNPLPVTPGPPSTTNAQPTSNSAPPTAQPVTTPQKVWPPEWLTAAMHAMQKKYGNDKFDVILRKTSTSPEWRIKCLDCPGKLYTPGPGETLSNYEVHLKNRLHRQRVNERLGIANPP